jgi:GT2 family glycosyltransferase
VKTSIIIVTYGQWEVTERCLKSLQATLGDGLGEDWEIVVVDNNSPDETPQKLRAWSDRITLELRPDNINFAGGCNRGAELAGGDVLIFLNNDTTVAPGSLERLAAQTREPGIAAAGCRLLFPDGTIQHAGVAFYSNPRLRGVPMPQHVFHHQAGELPGTRAVFDTDTVTSACFAVRREAFFEVGGYETRYVNGLEDIDLCLKLRMAGHGIVYRGDIDITHYEGASRGKGQALFATPEKLATMAANDDLFIGRWAEHLEQDDELGASVWDAELRDGFKPRTLTIEPNMIVLGQPTGLGPGADEARAFIVALHALGHRPAGMDLPNPNLAARLSGELAQIVDQAMRTPLGGAPILCVPMGPSDILYHPGGRTALGDETAVRLGTPHTALEVPSQARVLATSHAVRDALIHRGMEPERVAVLPSPIVPRALGTGGAGLLVVLPTHDPTLATELLEGLTQLIGVCAIRLLPTAFDRRLAGIVAERLPGAELLSPCSDEQRFAGWAAEADVVLAGNLDDPFERPALLAASLGTPALSLRPAGAAGDVLGTGVCLSREAARNGLARAVLAALDSAGDRPALQRRVLSACGTAAFSAWLERRAQTTG